MTTEKEYLIICDEPERKGKYFSNFYGGVRVACQDGNFPGRNLNLDWFPFFVAVWWCFY